MAKKRFGELKPQYHFSLNPYPDMRFSKCPNCNSKTGQRKLPLIIHIDPKTLMMLNYTNRYCKKCNTLIGHKDQIEHHLAHTFSQIDPDIVGNQYLILGTAEKTLWQASKKEPQSTAAIIKNGHDFLSYEEIRMTMEGWFPKDQKPPVMPPPASKEWVSIART